MPSRKNVPGAAERKWKERERERSKSRERLHPQATHNCDPKDLLWWFICPLYYLFLPTTQAFLSSFSLSVRQSGLLTAYLFIHFLIYWCLSDPTQTERQTVRQRDRLKHWNWKHSLPIEQLLRWLAAEAEAQAEAHKRQQQQQMRSTNENRLYFSSISLSI